MDIGTNIILALVLICLTSIFIADGRRYPFSLKFNGLAILLLTVGAGTSYYDYVNLPVVFYAFCLCLFVVIVTMTYELLILAYRRLSQS